MTLFKRQTSGSVVCPACGKLVGVAEEKCWNCGRRHPGMWGYGKALRSLGGELSVGRVVTWGCGALYVLSLLLDPGGIGMGGGLSILTPSPRSLDLLGWTGIVPVMVERRLWTLLSAGWLHGGVIHILFNMLWVRQLAPAASAVYGSGRAMVLYVGASVAGFALSTVGPIISAALPPVGFLLGGGSHTVGASAAIFGLLGALVYAGRRGVAVGLGQQAWMYAIFLFALPVVAQLFPGMSVLSRVDNWAHLGGFLGGYGLAAWFNPLRPERADHLFGGLAAVALSLLAVLFSLVRGLAG